jgi:hypothetical protein|tara:strand:+ start:219 stop:863 length:645 start_codon:yes stop_codon:yes gene_type:complete
MPNLNKLFPVVFFGLFSVLTAATITSVQDGDWDVPSTWDSASIPTSADDVIIANGHTVTIPTMVSVEMLSLTINSGGALYAGNFRPTLEVYGNWTNNGTFTAGNICTVIFKGAGNQSVDPGNDGFDYIELDNASNANTIAILDDIDISKDLTLTVGILDLSSVANPTIEIGGNVTIISGAVWTKGNGAVTLSGDLQNYADPNSPPNNLGNVVVD